MCASCYSTFPNVLGLKRNVVRIQLILPHRRCSYINLIENSHINCGNAEKSFGAFVLAHMFDVINFF